jgi:hypothetical protein
MKNERFTMSMVAATLLLSPALAPAENSGPGGVGVYTAVMGKVTVTHSGEPRMRPVKLHDEVLFSLNNSRLGQEKKPSRLQTVL